MNSLNVHPMKSFSAKVEASISTEAQAAHCCLFLSLSGYILNQPQWSILMHNTYISLICDKSVTTQNLAFLSYWYRKNVCRCTFNRYSVITQFVKLAAGEQLCRRCTRSKLEHFKTLKRFSWKITNFELWHCCRKWATYPNESRAVSYYQSIKFALSRVWNIHRLYNGLMYTKTKFTGKTKWRKVRTNINVQGGNRSNDAVVRLRNWCAVTGLCT